MYRKVILFFSLVLGLGSYVLAAEFDAAKLYQKSIDAYLELDTETAFEYSEILLDNNLLQDKNKLSRLHVARAHYYFEKRDLKLLNENIDKSIELSKKSNDIPRLKASVKLKNDWTEIIENIETDYIYIDKTKEKFDFRAYDLNISFIIPDGWNVQSNLTTNPSLIITPTDRSFGEVSINLEVRTSQGKRKNAKTITKYWMTTSAPNNLIEGKAFIGINSYWWMYSQIMVHNPVQIISRPMYSYLTDYTGHEIVFGLMVVEGDSTALNTMFRELVASVEISY